MDLGWPIKCQSQWPCSGFSPPPPKLVSANFQGPHGPHQLLTKFLSYFLRRFPLTRPDQKMIPTQNIASYHIGKVRWGKSFTFMLQSGYNIVCGGHTYRLLPRKDDVSPITCCEGLLVLALLLLPSAPFWGPGMAFWPLQMASTWCIVWENDS